MLNCKSVQKLNLDTHSYTRIISLSCLHLHEIAIRCLADLLLYGISSLFHLRTIKRLNEIKHRRNVELSYQNTERIAFMKWILTNGIPITWNRRNVRAIKAELKEFHSCILITYPRVGRIANIVVSQTEIWQKSIRLLFFQ